MGALKPIFDWDTPTSYDQLSGVLQAPTLKNIHLSSFLTAELGLLKLVDVDILHYKPA